jgi:lipopolysaccharide/colanic/teichoic acid biosynthesis glycosyltransferase
VSVLTLQHAPLPLLTAGKRRTYLAAKRCLDVAVCVCVGPLALLIGLLCVLAIRLDSPGPALLRQQRTGRDGARFAMWKFRSMVANADELKAQLAHLSVLPPPDFKIPDDPRITRVGRFLRATSLDELPQLWNVLRGEMTLVGPRPTTFEPSCYALWHTRRLEATPGLTGLWQVRGRNECPFDERLRLDIHYLDHQSLLLDLRILWLTVLAVARRSGA